MAKPIGMDIVRRAYELWEQAGKPDGKNQEFYLQLNESSRKRLLRGRIRTTRSRLQQGPSSSMWCTAKEARHGDARGDGSTVRLCAAQRRAAKIASF
jgi:hypothetical protein